MIRTKTSSLPVRLEDNLYGVANIPDLVVGDVIVKVCMRIDLKLDVYDRVRLLVFIGSSRPLSKDYPVAVFQPPKERRIQENQRYVIDSVNLTAPYTVMSDEPLYAYIVPEVIKGNNVRLPFDYNCTHIDFVFEKRAKINTPALARDAPALARDTSALARDAPALARDAPALARDTSALVGKLKSLKMRFVALRNELDETIEMMDSALALL